MSDKIKNVIIVVLVVILLAVACSPPTPSGEMIKNDDGFRYKIITIEGMTCVWVAETFMAEYAHAGLTCDWREYDG